MSHGDDTSIGSLLGSLWRSLLPAGLLAVAVAVMVFLVTSNLPPVYASSATLIASNTNPGLVRFDIALAAPPPIDLVAYRALATNPAVIEGARRFLSDPSLLDRVQITSSSEVMHLSSIIRIHARADRPDAAAEVANAVARSLVEWDQQRARSNLAEIVTVLEQQVVSIGENVAALRAAPNTPSEQLDVEVAALNERQQQLVLARALRASALGALDVVERAALPTDPIAPLPRSYAAIAFLVVAFVTFGLLLLSRALDPRITSEMDVAALAGAPVVATFERWRDDHELQALGFLRAHLDLAADRSRAPAVIVCTSPTTVPSKARLAASLARSFAEDGQRTLLLDADATGPALSTLLGVESGSAAPVSSHLSASASDHAPVVVPVAGGQIDLIPGSRRDMSVSDRLRRGFGHALVRWRERYDVIVVDTTPLLVAADALALTPHASSVLVVTDLARTTREQLRAVGVWLRRARIDQSGVVLIGSPGRRHRGRGVRRRAEEGRPTPVKTPSWPQREFPEGFG